MAAVDVLRRHNVTITGPEAGPALLFAHGFGCDQNMWRFVIPAFADRYRCVAFDYVGMGHSDFSAYDPDRYSTLDGYASDVLDICDALGLDRVVFVGHSVSSMIGVLAAKRRPGLFDGLVLVGPSPRYIDDEGYSGGFNEADIADLLDSLESNYLGWSSAMAPVIMGNGERPELGQELEAAFCRADPEVARRFARATFLSDNRADLAAVATPTLVLQCREDVIAPMAVGQFTAQSMPDAELVVLDATGHCPNLSAPQATADAITAFLDRLAAP